MRASGRILVTGGTGFLGRHVLPILAKRVDLTVVCFVRQSSDTEQARTLGFDLRFGQLEDAASLKLALADCHGMLSLAPLGGGYANTLVPAAEAAGIKRCLFVSTTAIFTGLAAASKRVRVAAEQRIMASALAWTIIRPTMIYGAPGDRNMERLLRYLATHRFVPVPGRGRALQQPNHVEDVARACVDAFESELAVGQAYNLGGQEALGFNQVIDAAAAALSTRTYKVHLPMKLLRFAPRVSSGVRGSFPVTTEQVRRLDEDKSCDYSSAARDFGYDPRGFQEGIATEIAALRETGWLPGGEH